MSIIIHIIPDDLECFGVYEQKILLNLATARMQAVERENYSPKVRMFVRRGYPESVETERTSWCSLYSGFYLDRNGSNFFFARMIALSTAFGVFPVSRAICE